MPFFVRYCSLHTLRFNHICSIGSLIARVFGATVVIISFSVSDFFSRVMLAAVPSWYFFRTAPDFVT